MSNNTEGLFGIFDLEQNTYKSIQDIDLETLLKDNYNDTISLLTQSNYHQLRRPLLVIFHHFKLKDTKNWIDKLHEVAIKFRKLIEFAVAELVDVELFHYDCNELDYFGFSASLEPYIFAIDAHERQYQFQERFTIDSLTRYCEKLTKNKLYRSDPIPTQTNANKNVEIIVADNFKEVVEQNEKDVFVTLHSNFSFQNESYLEELRMKLRDDKDILVFYEINVHTNYVPLQYRVSELPTSFLIRKNNKSKPLRYVHTNGEYLELRHFIAKNTSTELKVLDRGGYDK